VQRALLEHLDTCWQEPDAGLWEVRGPPSHFTYSKVMCWVAFDRAIKAVEELGLSGPGRAIGASCDRDPRGRVPARLAPAARRLRPELRLGRTRREPVAAPDDRLSFPPTILACAEPVDAIERRLTVDGLVLRYRTQPAIDGLPPAKACSSPAASGSPTRFASLGVRRGACALRAPGQLCNDVGLLAEEYDPASRRHLGNFPQAFSHVALVNTAMNLSAHAKPAEQRSGEKAA
jgi:GH15 family glucan-1,4-alpha-glucosidase